MLNTVKIDLNRREPIKAIKTMKKKERDAFLEGLFALPRRAAGHLFR